MKPGQIAKRWEENIRIYGEHSDLRVHAFISVLDLLDSLGVVPSASAKISNGELINDYKADAFVTRYAEAMCGK